MSTRSIIARAGEHEGQFSGRYIHSDGMPTSMGKQLRSLVHGHFRNDIGAMLRYLIDAPHAVAGWSMLVGCDFNLKPGYTWQKAVERHSKYEVYSKDPDYRRPQAFACRADEEAYLMTENDLEETDCEWLYVFHEQDRKMFVRDLTFKEDVAVIELDGPEPDWTAIECGDNFRRCKHYAWKHNLAPRTCNLSTQTYLGYHALNFRDAIAFIIDGKRWESTGSGGNSSVINQTSLGRGTTFPKNTWVATVKAKNGRHRDVAVADISGRDYTPLPGVQWVMPATKNEPEHIWVRA